MLSVSFSTWDSDSDNRKKREGEYDQAVVS